MNKIDLLEKHEYYSTLFEYYESLFTDKQKEYFRMYFFDDYSLGEISDIYKVSRNAIFDAINKILGLLDNYEEKLKLYQKDCELNDILNDYENKALTSNNSELTELVKKLRKNE